jgi:hypothetical protein
MQSAVSAARPRTSPATGGKTKGPSMPTYDVLYDLARLGDDARPKIHDFRFTSPSTVMEWARRDRWVKSKTHAYIFHLNVDGKFCCYSRAPSGESIFDWAEDAADLLRARRCGLASRGGCPPNWLIVETRAQGSPNLEVVPSEGDVEAFLEVREVVTEVGVHLVDDVIFDQTNRWWSLHEFIAPGQPYILRRR